jgi:hypothetical protein
VLLILSMSDAIARLYTIRGIVLCIGWEKEVNIAILWFTCKTLRLRSEKIEVEFSTFVVVKRGFNRLTEVNSLQNQIFKSIQGIRLLPVNQSS